MKKYLIITLFLAFVYALYSYAATSSYQSGTSNIVVLDSDVMYAYISETDKDVNDFSTTLSIGNAILDRIVVDSNGTDTSFKLYLYETSTTWNNVTLWSKADFSTDSEPTSYALTMADTDANDYRGIPTTGELQVTLADGDDATMSGIEIFIFYRRQ